MAATFLIVNSLANESSSQFDVWVCAGHWLPLCVLVPAKFVNPLNIYTRNQLIMAKLVTCKFQF